MSGETLVRDFRIMAGYAGDFIGEARRSHRPELYADARRSLEILSHWLQVAEQQELDKQAKQAA
jgi:hypothetical protein